MESLYTSRPQLVQRWDSAEAGLPGRQDAKPREHYFFDKDSGLFGREGFAGVAVDMIRLRSQDAAHNWNLVERDAVDEFDCQVRAMLPREPS
jgi:hypothetical protein